jgi:hypothetical protein
MMEDTLKLREKVAIKKMELQLEEYEIRILELQNEIEKVKELKAQYNLKILEKKKELGEK